MAFIPTEINLTQELIKNSHGYTIDEVSEIKTKFKELEVKVLSGYTHSIEEYKTIVIPHIRINRSEAFNLFQKDVKEKPLKPIKEKVVKPKKLTKKAIKDKIEGCLGKLAFGEALSDDEWNFFNEHTKSEKLL